MFGVYSIDEDTVCMPRTGITGALCGAFKGSQQPISSVQVVISVYSSLWDAVH